MQGEDTPKQPKNAKNEQGADSTSDRAQPELSEQNLVSERLSQEQSPKRRDGLEEQLEDMTDDIKDANSR